MSKKKNKKFKKQGSKTFSIPQNVRDDAKTADFVEDDAETADSGEVTSRAKEQIDPRYQAIRKDVRKVLLTITVLLVILVGTYFLRLKTGILTSFGEWMYKITNIQSL